MSPGPRGHAEGDAPPFRVGFVEGATPDKWARAWRERRPAEPLELVPVAEAEQEEGLRSGALDMALVRLPVRRDGLHLVRLYDERPVVVAAADHLVAAADPDQGLATADLDDEQLVLPHPSGWRPSAAQLDWPPMGYRDAVETAASGAGVAVVPMSVARLHHRKDAVHRPVSDLPGTTVGLAWLVERDDERTQAFVGITRGRTARSSRG